MCAVAVVAIAATALFVGFDNGFAMLRQTREDLRATQILMQKTEAIRLVAWNDLTNLPPTIPFREYYTPPGTNGVSSGTVYYGTINTTAATNIPGSPPYLPYIHLITINLVWTNYIGSGSGSTAVSHTRQMQTLSALGGMQGYIWNPLANTAN
jgi:hypothetical protein